jgi:hypothetical protein
MLERTFRRIENLNENMRRISFSILILVATLFILAETSRGILIPDSKRVYGISLAGLLMYLALIIGKNRRSFFPIFFVLSFFFPPILMLALIPFRIKRKDEAYQAPAKGMDLLSASYGSNLVICKSVRIMSSLATSLAIEISKRRRVILVDWSGEASKRFRDIEHRIASPSDIWLGYKGILGSSYDLTLSELLSYFGVDQSAILNVIRKRDIRSPVDDILLPLSEERVRIDEALPKPGGALIIDLSKLNARGKNAISLMVLLQCLAYDERDFLVISPLLSPITDERLHGKVRDEIKWIISSLSKSGCFILSTHEASQFSDEFDTVLECDSCATPIYRLNGFRLCPWIGGKGKRLF